MSSSDAHEAQELKCPNCGATLGASAPGSAIVCSFCGHASTAPAPVRGPGGGSGAGRPAQMARLRRVEQAVARQEAVQQLRAERVAQRMSARRAAGGASRLVFGIIWVLVALAAGGAAVTMRAHGSRAMPGVAIFAAIALLIGVSAIAGGMRRL